VLFCGFLVARVFCLNARIVLTVSQIKRLLTAFTAHTLIGCAVDELFDSRQFGRQLLTTGMLPRSL
jgi:hypothetical protein